MKKSFACKCIGALVACAIPVGLAHAEERAGGGSVTYTVIRGHEAALANGGKLVHALNAGVIIADDASVPFHMASQNCMNAAVLNADGSAAGASGHCTAMDGDGDTWSLWWRGEGEGEGSAWQIIGGTGKFAGMTGGGTTTTLHQAADGRTVITWQGTWDLN